MADVATANAVTTAVTVAASSGIENWIPLGVAAIIGSAFSIQAIVRRFSKDRLELTKDRVEGDLVLTLREERDNALKEAQRVKERLEAVEMERNESVSKVGKLTAEVETLAKQADKLQAVVEKVGTKLDEASTELHNEQIKNARLTERLRYLEGSD